MISYKVFSLFFWQQWCWIDTEQYRSTYQHEDVY